MPVSSLVNPHEIARQLFQDNWPIRRRWLRIGILTLSLNAELVLVAILLGSTNPVLVQIFITLIGAIMSIFMFYVFGAVWDDNDKRRHFGSLRERMKDPDSAPPEDEE